MAVTGPLLVLPLPDDGRLDHTTVLRTRPAASTPAGPARALVGPRWQWPLTPRPAVTRPFRAPAGPYGPGHRGVDLAAESGVDVLAVEGGVVTHAGRVAGRGTVSVLHAGGLTSTYEPVRPRVVAGTHVDAGHVLGSLDPPGTGPGAPPAPGQAGGHCLLTTCLHLGARRGAVYVDPLLLLRGARVRLLPVGPGQPTTG